MPLFDKNKLIEHKRDQHTTSGVSQFAKVTYFVSTIESLKIFEPFSKTL